MAEHHTAGSLVWVQDTAEGWVKGVVEKVVQDKLQVKTANGSVQTCKPEDTPLQNPSSRMGVEVEQLCCTQTSKLQCPLQAAFTSTGEAMLGCWNLVAAQMRTANLQCCSREPSIGPAVCLLIQKQRWYQYTTLTWVKVQSCIRRLVQKQL